MYYKFLGGILYHIFSGGGVGGGTVAQLWVEGVFRD